MYGNGVATGMAIIKVEVKVILRGHHLARPAWLVAGAGAVIRSTAGCRFATTATPATGTTTLVSAWCLSHSSVAMKATLFEQTTLPAKAKRRTAQKAFECNGVF